MNLPKSKGNTVARKPATETPVESAPSDGPRFANLVGGKPTRTQQAFASWLGEHTGYQVDDTSVRLAMALTKEFRSSPEQVEARTARKDERANHAENVEARKAARREASAARLEAKAAAIRDGSARGPGRPAKPVTATGEAVEQLEAEQELEGGPEVTEEALDVDDEGFPFDKDADDDDDDDALEDF
jgi:hypothetical protein